MSGPVTSPAPQSAPSEPSVAERSWTKYLPTNKWWASTVVAAGTIVTMVWTAGIHTSDDKTFVVGLVTQRIVAYITRN